MKRNIVGALGAVVAALQPLDCRLREGPVDWDQALEAMARHQLSGPSPPP